MITQNQLIFHEAVNDIEVWMKREDLIHPFVSGNKYRKLKYNLLQAKKENCNTLITFGGAFSNHIAAVAYAGQMHNFRTIGIIRGEELANKVEDNPTLKFATENGMQFHFVSREVYRQKQDVNFFDDLKILQENCYLIPEGGTNEFAVQGCEEILTENDSYFTHLATAVGTGGTICGIINASNSAQEVLGFPALKGDFLSDAIRIFAKQQNWKLIQDYHFGGYGKVSSSLIAFLNQFSNKHHFLLDPVYTGKMMFGIFDLIEKGYFKKGSKILTIHTGGLQGIAGMNILLRKKNQEIIQTDV